MAVGSTLDVERRRQGIAEELRSTGAVRIDDAAMTWRVDPMTIRRHLRSLEQDGIARLVRGGAVFAGLTGVAPGGSRRCPPSDASRRRRSGSSPGGRRSASTRPPLPARSSSGCGPTTCSSSPTGWKPSRHCRNGRALAPISRGGRDPRTGSLVGPLTLRALHSFRLSRCFVSATGVHPVLGCTKPTAEEVEMKQAMVSLSSPVVLVADSTKLDRRGQVRLIGLDQVDVLLTELAPGHERLKPHRGLVQIV